MDQREAGERKRILVSDDTEAIGVIWQSNFEAEGYEVRLSLDSRETLELASSWQPHLITTDILKPEIDGVELVRRLKADDVTKHIPVVIISATAGDPEFRHLSERAVEAGACAVIAKPVDPPALLELVREVLDAD